MTNDWLDYDHFLYNKNPPCPRCKKEMHVAVLSGGSDPTGHTNEYYCEWCPQELKIRVTISVRDPVAVKFEKESAIRIKKSQKWDREHPIICATHYKYAWALVTRNMGNKVKEILSLPVRLNI